MKDIVIIDGGVPQWKGNLHLHTDRSPDCKTPYHDVLAEHRAKGYHFCLVTDHEKYWDSEEEDRDGFFTLSGVETILKANPDRTWITDSKKKFLHLNLLKDVTRDSAYPFRHDERTKRLYDQGLDSWNAYIAYLQQVRGQMVILNHPNWSRMDPESMLAIQGCFAFEVYNTSANKYVGCQTDDAIWDYCLQRGRRILAVAGDDSHSYGPDHCECGGGFTMVCTPDFSRAGIVSALKRGAFYASMGPRIYDMRITDGILSMRFSEAQRVEIVAFGGHGKGIPAHMGQAFTEFQWKINTALNYFRVRILAANGDVAWSQPVFVDDLIEHPPFDVRETTHPDWSVPRYLDELLEEH